MNGGDAVQDDSTSPVEAGSGLSDSLLAGVLSSSPDGIMAFRSVRDGAGSISDFTWLVVNPAAEAIVGRSPSDLVGRRLLVEMPGNADDGLFDRYVEVVESGRSYTLEHHYEHEGLDHWFSTTAVKMDDGFAVTFRDISDHKRLENSLELQALTLVEVNRVLLTVTKADSAVVHATSESALLEQTCRIIVETGGYHLAWIADFDPDVPGRPRPLAQYGPGVEFVESLLAASHGGPAQSGKVPAALASGETQLLDDVATLDIELLLRRISLEHGVRSQLALPLVVDQVVIGALSIHATKPGAFDRAEITLFEQLAGNLAYGISSVRAREELTRYADQLERSSSALLDTFAAIVEVRDPYTAGHQDRVGVLAEAMARELGLDEQEIAGIRSSARLHDIGKIGIPAEILTKPSKLTPAEFELIKQHPQAGHDIVRNIEFPWPVARMILEHHERLDGSGYPNGLTGEETLLGSHIIAVADTVEAMVSHRPYRPGLGAEMALAQITADRGTRLDPDAVDACLRLFRDHGFQFPRLKGFL